MPNTDLEKNNEVCRAHDVLTKMLSRFEGKLDSITDNFSEFNTKFAGFLAKHNEQEKRFQELHTKVESQGKELSESAIALALSENNYLRVCKKMDSLEKAFDTMKTLMYTGVISGLFATLVVCLQLGFGLFVK
jgi:hypothetical protein